MFLSVVLLLAVMTACSNGGQESNLTMNDFIQAYVGQGVEVDPEEKQLFQMVDASDGVIFYMDGSPVKIYEYKSSKALKDAVKKHDLMSDWPTNGRFILETKKEEAIKIFNEVK